MTKPAKGVREDDRKLAVELSHDADCHELGRNPPWGYIERLRKAARRLAALTTLEPTATASGVSEEMVTRALDVWFKHNREMFPEFGEDHRRDMRTALEAALNLKER